MPKLEGFRIPTFTCRNKRVIKNVIREIGKEDFEKSFAVLGKEPPKKLHGFHLEYKSGKILMFYQWITTPTLIMDVTAYMGMCEDWHLFMKNV